MTPTTDDRTPPRTPDRWRLAFILGLVPLVLFPGAGSELYRGLGAVFLGGLLISTIFTLILVPTLFSLTMDVKERTWDRLLSGDTGPSPSPTARLPVVTEPAMSSQIPEPVAAES